MITLIKRTVVLLLFCFSSQVFAKLPYFPISFPRDEGAHFENVPYTFNKMMEWWYYNGTLTSQSGKKLGYYMSFNYIYEPTKKIMLPFIQIQITDIDTKKVYAKTLYLLDKQSYSMDTNQLNVQAGSLYSLWKENGSYRLKGNILSEQGSAIEFNMTLTQKKDTDVLLVAEKGLVDMWNDANSYYYSYTKLITEGYLKIGDELYQLDPARSLSWMDHQWGDFIIIPGQNQWMWSSMQLSNGVDINFGVILDSKTKQPKAGGASVVASDNSRLFYLDLKQFTYTHDPVKPGEKHPMMYHLVIPEMKLDLNIEAFAPGQDLNGIWEGVSKITGTQAGAPVTGQAYTENTVIY